VYLPRLRENKRNISTPRKLSRQAKTTGPNHTVREAKENRRKDTGIPYVIGV